ARASRKTIRIWSQAVPYLPGALELASEGIASAGLLSNRESIDPDVAWDEGVPEATRRALVDPQTSGGLLIAVAPSRAERLLGRLRKARVSSEVVGEVLARGRVPLEVQA
ncbi:MAG TPA: AIR synthase-related protein, partial [Candidatus Eisenbacteria bacterium]|nr:AIR synthase-related protein [Candidatus Eisenbacteria bacterium]